MAYPHVPGAEFVGNQQCAVCHPDIEGDFQTAAHAGLGILPGEHSDRSCELCHGPGSLHVAAPGPGNILALNQNPSACFNCHLDKRAQAGLPHAHPILEGQVACGDCHDPHAGPSVAVSDRGLSPESQTCYECHTAQSGPFVFEHEAMREGCTLCHEPHGSVNFGMLKIRDGNLCLQCHLTTFEEDDVRIGKTLHAGLGYLPQGACWTTGCHEAVHGSHVDSNLRF